MSRTDFEAAYIERYGHRPRGWNDDFQVYQDAHANGAWFGWQARAAGIEAKAAPAGEHDDDRAAIHQLAFELGGTEDGEYLLDLDDLNAVIDAAHQRQQAREVVMPEIPYKWSKSLTHCWPDDKDDRDGDWCVGCIDEEGNFYEVVKVEASQYDAGGESQKIAEAIVALWEFARLNKGGSHE